MSFPEFGTLLACGMEFPSSANWRSSAFGPRSARRNDAAVPVLRFVKASGAGQLDVVKLLVARGADVNIRVSAISDVDVEIAAQNLFVGSKSIKVTLMV